MNPDRWNRIEEVFHEAVDLPVDARAGYLEQACSGDEELRRQVERLIASDRNAQVRIAATVEEAAASLSESTRPPWNYVGRRIGPYEVVREIGRGGMGTVYQAVRIDEQYLRSVAIKFVHGMATPEVLARFRIERQILATLQHPNIAALLDGGTTEDGQPYLVMEYIEGRPVLDYCRERSLSVQQRLELFRQLAGAVHHAHQMLVIHRDIKPANVLVTADGIPKLLDFGIAKLLAPELVAGATAALNSTLRRMTPEYASPEQIRGEPLTTATDVYSLGVLLYEMLSFASPYRFDSGSLQEIEHAVLETEPRRLSEAVREDPRLRRQLAGDLENVVAMALRKEPERRYGSAQQFSEDIDRYMKQLPVMARKDTLLYLTGKLVRRNKLASVAFVLLAVAIAAGWTATIREARRAERRFQEVRKLAHSVLFEFHGKIQHLPGSTPAREMLVHTALEYLNSLSRDSSDDLSLQWELSQAYEQIGDVQGDPSGANLGKYSEALTSYHRSRDLVEKIAAKKRDWHVLSCLAWLHFKSGDMEFRTETVQKALESYGQGLRIADAIAAELNDPRADDLRSNGYERVASAQLRSDLASALNSARSAAEAADRGAKRRGDSVTSSQARSHMLLGNILWLRGDLAGAWKNYETAVASLEQLLASRPDHTEHLTQLSEAYRRAGDLQGNPAFFHFDDQERAAAFHEKGLKIAEQLAARDPQDAQAKAGLSLALRRVGLMVRQSDPDKSAAALRRALDIGNTLLAAAPGDLNHQRNLANTRLALSTTLRVQGNLAAALEQLNAALEGQQAILKRNPAGLLVREDMFDSLAALGDVRLAMGQTEAALEQYNAALGMAQYLVERAPENLYSERCLALASRYIAEYHTFLARRGPPAERSRHAAEAAAWYDKAIAIWSRWRSNSLALPYSLRQETEVTRARLALGLPAQ